MEDTFQPYGKEWKEEVLQIPITALEEIFQEKKEEYESKKQFIRRVAVKLKKKNSQ